MKRILIYLFFILVLMFKPIPYLIEEPKWLVMTYKQETYYVEYGINYQSLIERLNLSDVCHQYTSSYLVYHDITFYERKKQVLLSDVSIDTLIVIKGIGPVLASRIMMFIPSIEAIEDLDLVKGVGPKLMHSLTSSLCF